MVEFKILKLDDNGNLHIRVSVISHKWYTNVYLSNITIDNQDTYVENGPSKEPLLKKIITGNAKEYDLEVSRKNLSNDILFIYVQVKGIPSEDTPCGFDKIITMRTFVDLHSIYDIAMNYMRELANTCSIPSNFIDFILRFNAFKLAIQDNNYLLAIKYWKWFFNNIEYKQATSNCGCNK